MKIRLLNLFLALPFLLYGQSSQKKLLTVEDIFTSSKFREKTLQGYSWMKNGEQLSYQQYDTNSQMENIYLFHCSDGSRSLLVDVSLLKLRPDDPPFRYSSYQWSPQEDKILFASAPPDNLNTIKNFHPMAQNFVMYAAIT